MDNEQCTKLIKLYGSYKLLWDSKDPNYTNKGLREDVWKNISEKMSLPVGDLKKKMESLLGSYRREKSREKQSRNKSLGRQRVYTSKWYAYEYFQFMSHKNNLRDTKDTVQDIQVLQPFKIPKQTAAKKRRVAVRKNEEEYFPTRSQTTQKISAHTTQTIDEFDALAISWAAKVRKFDEDQKVLAEDLINQVLKKAYFKELTRTTKIEDNSHCRQISESTPANLSTIISFSNDGDSVIKSESDYDDI